MIFKIAAQRVLDAFRSSSLRANNFPTRDTSCFFFLSSKHVDSATRRNLFQPASKHPHRNRQSRSHSSQEKLISRVAIIAQLSNYNRCGRSDTKHISRKGKNPRNSPANSRKSPHPFPRGVRYVPSVAHAPSRRPTVDEIIPRRAVVSK